MSRKQYHHGNLKQAIVKKSLLQLNLVGANELGFRTITKNHDLFLLLRIITPMMKIPSLICLINIRQEILTKK